MTGDGQSRQDFPRHMDRRTALKTGAGLVPMIGLGRLPSEQNSTETDTPSQTMDGSGTESDPYVIETVEHLQAMAGSPSAHYILGRDIDASETSDWNDGSGFEPVGDLRESFEGSFDGREHTITGLTIDRPDKGMVGLFGVAFGASIQNLVLVDFEVAGNSIVGGLGGWLIDSAVQTVSVAGTVDATDAGAGLLAGGFDGDATLQNCTSRGRITGDSNIGGVVGRMDDGATVRDCESTASVVIDLHPSNPVGSNLGGLVGHVQPGCRVVNSFATGPVDGRSSSESGSLDNYIGGLVGKSFGDIEHSHATGTVVGRVKTGGLVGLCANGSVQHSYATGPVTADKYMVGGLIGRVTSDSSVTHCYASGRVTGTGSLSGRTNAGGLVGSNRGGRIETCYATSDVDGAAEIVGGLIGENYSESVVTDCYAVGEVQGENPVGGLIGHQWVETSDGTPATISASYWDLETTGLSHSAGLPDESGLTTAQMQGDNAVDEMSGFDFETSWQVEDGVYPTLPDVGADTEAAGSGLEVPVETEAPESADDDASGFGLLSGLAGLGIVSFLLRRRQTTSK